MQRANEYLIFSSFMADLLDTLRTGATVTRFRLEAAPGKEEDDIEFEVRVTRIGKDKLPRITQAQVAKLDRSQPTTTGATAP